MKLEKILKKFNSLEFEEPVDKQLASLGIGLAGTAILTYFGGQFIGNEISEITNPMSVIFGLCSYLVLRDSGFVDRVCDIYDEIFPITAIILDSKNEKGMIKQDYSILKDN